jgi:eukaryotic-like serine/threonine-protein kinase
MGSARMGERVAAGDVLAGKYRVERVLGAGGMGVVVAARHVQLDFLVALKFMTDEALADPELVSRFLREARAAARLRSEHVARVTDVGTLESGAPYHVIEYLEGMDLAAVLASEGRQPIPRAVEYVIQACEALDEAHHAGIVHRDVKPSNLFLTKRPNGTACIKVLDFGISKFDRLGGSSAKLHATHSRAILGSPFYMAPEQMRSSREADARADIWALGATLYELLTGRVPFQGDSLLELALHAAQREPTPLRQIRPEIPWPLEQVVMRCLEKDRDDRFGNVRTLSAALAPFMQRKQEPLLGSIPLVTWREETTVESMGDTVTRVADAPVAAEAVVQSVVPRSDRPPTPVSAPPVSQGAPRGWRTGAVSWGRSQKRFGKSARTTWGIGSVAALATCGIVIALVTRSHAPPESEREIAPVSAAPSTPPTVPATIGVVADASTSASVASALIPAAKASVQIPTWSVADLPIAAKPPPIPPSPEPAQPPAIAPSPVRLQGSAQPSAQPPTQRSTQPPAPAAPPPTQAPPSRSSDPLANPN